VVDDSIGEAGAAAAARGGALAAGARLVVACVVHAAQKERLARGAQDIPTVQVEVRVGGKVISADLRRRRGLKRFVPLLKARLAITRCRVKPQDGCEGAPVNKALPPVAARLKGQRINVRLPRAGHYA